MSKLRIFKEIENSIWILRFENDSEALTSQDKELMDKFGEPEINVGGSFGEDPNDYTLPDNYVKVRSGFPWRQEFDSRQAPFNTNTQTKVDAYKTAITSRFTSAFTTLRANSDAWSGEEVVTV